MRNEASGASSLLRHDQDPRFMSEVFTRFRDLLGSRQRATLAYRPQANGHRNALSRQLFGSSELTSQKQTRATGTSTLKD
jgi:hypothetical protein